MSKSIKNNYTSEKIKKNNKNIHKTGSSKQQRIDKITYENILPKIKIYVDNIFNTKKLNGKLETWICIGLLLVSLLVFYNDIIFSDKIFLSPDGLNASISGGVLGKDEFPLWTSYVFSGMPSYGSLMTTGNRWYDLSKDIYGYLQLITGKKIFVHGRLIYYYFLLGLSLFLFMRHKNHNNIVSTFTAIAILFCTTIVGWAFDGHNTKIIACAFFPFILLLVDKLKEKMNWLFAAALVFAVHLELESAHIQMIYYFFLFLSIYLVYSIFRNLKNKEQLFGFIRSTAILIISIVFAFLMSADRYLSTFEYSKYSIRGCPPLVVDPKLEQQSNVSGSLDYNYATDWSFSPEELITFIIPSFYGFGKIDNYVGNIPFKQYNIPPNTYFGPMKFTDAPQYFGALILIMAIIGFIYFRKDIFVQSLLIVILFSLFVSFGKELPILYNFMFNYFPFFNKFRAPVMILILLEISMVILAGYGLSALIDVYKNRRNNKNIKRLLYATIAIVCIMLFSLFGEKIINNIYHGVFLNALNSNTHQNIVQFINANPELADSEYAAIFSNMIKDLQFSLLIFTLFFGFGYLFLKKIIHPRIFYFLIIGILLLDLWRIDSKPFETKPQSELKYHTKKPAYIKFIENDKSLFRVVELNNQKLITSNRLAAFGLQNINGYSAAKLRIYQDAIENCFGFFLWNMLNTKYIISSTSNRESVWPYAQDSNKTTIYSDSNWVTVFSDGISSFKIMENVNCLPRTFFVNNFLVKDKIDIIKSLKDGSFNPREIAYLETDPGVKIDPVESGIDIKITNYSIHNMCFDIIATGNNLLFISEIYYPAGWKAYIDKKETPIYKTNYLFRSILVPKGKHKVEMNFYPESYKIGKQITLWMNLVVLNVAGFFIIKYFIKKKNNKKE